MKKEPSHTVDIRMTRLTPEREADIREYYKRNPHHNIQELIAEIDALRAQAEVDREIIDRLDRVNKKLKEQIRLE